jgi:hypothetical protein
MNKNTTTIFIYFAIGAFVIFVLYNLFKKREGFQSQPNELTSGRGARGDQGEVIVPEQNTGIFLRLFHTSNGKCNAPNQNANGVTSYLYNPSRDFVSPAGKKMCIGFRNMSYLYSNPERIFNSTNGAVGDQGEVAMLMPPDFNSPRAQIMRLQYTTNGRCIVSNPNPYGFQTFLYNPTRDLVSPAGRKICITVRQIQRS